jgi:formate hydrogenlyase subunit 3/multisubunit Na+/H+ antiporter MnhD subunit
VQPWFVALAVIGVINSAIAAAYYLRIVATMFFRLPLGTPPTRPDAGGTLAAAVGCAALVVFLGLFPGVWLGQAERAARGPVAVSAASATTPRPAANSEVGIPNSEFPSPEPRTLNPEP